MSPLSIGLNSTKTRGDLLSLRVRAASNSCSMSLTAARIAASVPSRMMGAVSVISLAPLEGDCGK
jgi:hypothetical protein